MIPADISQPKVSVVLTAHNEGQEVIQTIRSIQDQTTSAVEIVLVDDASNDRCCEFARSMPEIRLVEHPSRMGIARSRLQGSSICTGDVLAYLDSHQRVEGDTLLRCSKLAVTENSIVCPDVCGFDDDVRLHGAYFTRCQKQNFFSAEWKLRSPRHEISRVSSLKAPAYFIPRSVYSRIKWSPLLRGWGGSEACISLKAFFLDVPILHLCGPLIRHQFKRTFHYEVGWPEVWRNHAIIARICFDDRTWYQYWLPEVFDAHLDDVTKQELESEEIKAEQLEFAKFKVRKDSEFWTRLTFRKLPAALE